MRQILAAGLVGAGLLLPACTRHTIKIEPIHITMDVNITVDRKLDKFFEFEQEVEKKSPEKAPEKK
jgi:hypothetical protein